jgi:hypothetical protein
MSDIIATESQISISPIEQKVRDAFAGYPPETQRDISRVLELQKKHWETLRSLPSHEILKREATKSVVENGHVYETNQPLRDIPKRSLTETEKQERAALLQLLAPYELPMTYGIPLDGPNTRFYLSLLDTPHTIHFMVELTQTLLGLHKSGTLPFFEYKFSSLDEERQLRFDPSYRDKGGAPILYVADQDVAKINMLLEDLSRKYPDIFLPQKAPFKLSPHGGEYDNWHIAMEAKGTLNTITPEQGMLKAVSVFMKETGLTKQWTPVQSLDVVEMRNAWEKAVMSVGRQPQRPWITTDRPPPNLLNR